MVCATQVHCFPPLRHLVGCSVAELSQAPQAEEVAGPGQSPRRWLLLHVAIACPKVVAALAGITIAVNGVETQFNGLLVEVEQKREVEPWCLLHSPLPVRVLPGLKGGGLQMADLSFQGGGRDNSKAGDTRLQSGSLSCTPGRASLGAAALSDTSQRNGFTYKPPIVEWGISSFSASKSVLSFVSPIQHSTGYRHYPTPSPGAKDTEKTNMQIDRTFATPKPRPPTTPTRKPLQGHWGVAEPKAGKASARGTSGEPARIAGNHWGLAPASLAGMLGSAEPKATARGQAPTLKEGRRRWPQPRPGSLVPAENWCRQPDIWFDSSGAVVYSVYSLFQTVYA
ncbi:hypothetical protein QTO34_001221 [Cnephaeus nilssonii]|uniref:Uncharacterized protein n=1 Tax=Cnephaeus nilssonii TaxID=3371016 RepID=A0AA40HVA7_CNENI|nr:hypothetical protein QTO34_001221 [Eptesicus nilssonii]